ncbi:MAG: DNA polymerase III subunit gamma/tau [Pseudomonadales bacterium]
MSYQVLARKWRPKSFRELVGQEHVLQALVNALDRDRLHHAYLFTGTRGVGKTTIARILARCLNCEAGVSSQPCGQCSACQEINEGRFIDLIEVDAASRTKVEDTRELLENVQYAPTRGRYKVYLIDEVHMLSTHSFNALLKTLEEPPPHVKFLLATTDPQKLPATILSRCLQFNLKNITPERIVGHLTDVLGQEMIEFEEPALWGLAGAAEGSMRDALSLTDQAIAFGSGKVLEQDVSSMLGSVDRGVVLKLIHCLAAGDGQAVFQQVANLAEYGADYASVLTEMTSQLHGLAVAQAVPEALDPSRGDIDALRELAATISAEEVQLYYQMAINGRRDLPFAPDLRAGFEMVLLRMLSFAPMAIPTWAEQGAEVSSEGVSSAKKSSSRTGQMPGPAEALAVKTPPVVPAREQSLLAMAAEPTSRLNEDRPTERKTLPEESRPPWIAAAAPAPVVQTTNEPAVIAQTASVPVAVLEHVETTEAISLVPANWPQIVESLPVKGVVRNIIMNCALEAADSAGLELTIDQQQSSLFNENYRQRIEQALREYGGASLKVTITVGSPGQETPAARLARLKAERMAAAVAELQNDPNVAGLVANFDGELVLDSVQPRDE